MTWYRRIWHRIERERVDLRTLRSAQRARRALGGAVTRSKLTYPKE